VANRNLCFQDVLDLEASQKRDMLNLHTRFLQRLQDNRETRRNICLGLQQVLLHGPYPQNSTCVRLLNSTQSSFVLLHYCSGEGLADIGMRNASGLPCVLSWTWAHKVALHATSSI